MMLGAVRKSMIRPYSQIRDTYLFKAGWLFGKVNYNIAGRLMGNV